MHTQTKIGLVVGTVVAMLIVAVVGAVWLGGEPPRPDEQADDAIGESVLVREDSRILGQQGTTDVTFVEFLDFECEACRAAYPVIEELREEYAGRVTFVVRYFPLDGHFNSERAARAVESAARQGQFEAMYRMMFETQSAWGDADVPHDDLFRSYASELGLDLTRYDADYASDEVAERVQRDYDEAIGLNLTATPTIYIGGRLVKPETVGDLYDAVDEALAGAEA